MELMTDTERQLATERQLKYQSTVKFNLDQIFIHPSVDRETDPKNVERLREIFAEDSCQRLDLKNHVTATVSKQHLREACQAASV